MEVRFDEKTVPKIDAEKVSKNHGKRSQFGRRQGSKNPPTLGVCVADRVVGGGFTSAPLHRRTLGPNDPKKVKRWKK